MIRWKDGKVDRSQWEDFGAVGLSRTDDLADALDVAVAALWHITLMAQPSRAPRVAVDALRQIGVEHD